MQAHAGRPSSAAEAAGEHVQPSGPPSPSCRTASRRLPPTTSAAELVLSRVACPRSGLASASNWLSLAAATVTAASA